MAARVAGVDLLDDHRNLEQAESVDEERVLNRATDMLFVSRDQFAPGQVPFAAAGMDAESGVLY